MAVVAVFFDLAAKGFETGQIMGAGDSIRSRSTFRWALFGVATLWVLSGCGADAGPPKNTEGLQNLQPVSGSVSFEGKPTPGAIVAFVPADDPEYAERRIAGEVEEDGSFEMRTTVGAGSRPGVEPGEYLVTISWSVREDPTDKDSNYGPDLLPVKYKDYKTSELHVEILRGANELDPFELTP